MSILVVEDDKDISMLLKRGFEMEGYDVDCAGSGEEAMTKIASKPYSTMILDIMLPRQSGLEVCKDLRKSGNDLTVIMLSARDAVPDRIEGLSAGADDYVIKPFEFAELLARVRAHERRDRGAGPQDDDRLDIGAGLLFDAGVRKVETDETSVLLTEREADLLLLFVSNAGKPLSRIDIFRALWANDGGNAINVVDVYVGYLRRKLATLNVDAKSIIKTVRGMGFLFDPK
ncbi:MAG: response regulator transcription factor [Aestuariivirgaceae bacterium]